MNVLGLLGVDTVVAAWPDGGTGPRTSVVERDGVAVTVELRPRRHLDSTELELPAQWVVDATVRAPMPGSRRLRMAAWPGTYFVAFGRQDVLLDHHAFDDRFVVKTADAELTRFWLGDDELAALLATYEPVAARPFAFQIADGELELRARSTSHPEPTAPLRLPEAIAAAAQLGGRAHRLAAAWRARGATLGLVPSGDVFDTDGGYVLRSDARRAALELSFPDAVPSVSRRGLRTVVRAPRTSPADTVGALWRDALPRWDRPAGAKLRGAAFEIAGLGGHDRGGPWLAAALAPHAGALAAAAPDAVAITPGTVELRWERYLDDVAAIVAGLDVVEQLAAPHPGGGDGPYR
ncbi:MAG: hypothetical protein R2939_07750 [Kofleriaceae bacterium]